LIQEKQVDYFIDLENSFVDLAVRNVFEDVLALAEETEAEGRGTAGNGNFGVRGLRELHSFETRVFGSPLVGIGRVSLPVHSFIGLNGEQPQWRPNYARF
jgi:hypothetical protein